MSERTLKIVLGLEIAIGAIWTLLAAMAHGPGGLAVFGVFLIVYAIFAGFFLLAAWAFWKHPEQRRRAGWIMLLPVVFWFAPMVIRTAAGGHLSAQQFAAGILLAVMAAVMFCWLLSRKAAGFVPDALIRSRFFNWLIVIAMLGGWLFFVLVIYYVANEPSSSSTGGTALAYAIVLAALYLVWLGVGSFVASTWAWLCMRSETDGKSRGLSIAQLLIAAPGLLVGISVAVWLSRQGQL